MALHFLNYVDLPAHVQPGGFDHAAVHLGLSRVYVAHTANATLDVIDGETNRYLHSIPGFTGVAGALVSQENNLILTSNRGENTVSILTTDDETGTVKVAVGPRPNGLAYNFKRNVLLVAHVGGPASDDLPTVMLLDVATRQIRTTIKVPGRTRWTVFDASSDTFYVNIADPPQIMAVSLASMEITRSYPISISGPHGLDIDSAQQRLFCACDGGSLVTLDIVSGEVLAQVPLSGVPDVIFWNGALQHLYVAVGDPGVIDVFDTTTMERIETVPTEKGAHTLAFDARRNKVYAFLPQTHRAAVYLDEPE